MEIATKMNNLPLEQACEKIAKQKREIIDNFCKTYLAAAHYRDEDLMYLIPNLVLNEQMVNHDGKIGYKYWITINEVETVDDNKR